MACLWISKHYSLVVIIYIFLRLNNLINMQNNMCGREGTLNNTEHTLPNVKHGDGTFCYFSSTETNSSSEQLEICGKT